jgi:hypothetical protein
VRDVFSHPARTKMGVPGKQANNLKQAQKIRTGHFDPPKPLSSLFTPHALIIITYIHILQEKTSRKTSRAYA